jgi:GTP-binding protein EngB required for normal cell division
VSLTDRLREAMRRGDGRVDADALVRRIEALDRFSKVAGPHVPANDLTPATELVARAGGRLALSRDHTVVALAGATGSGKSSLFNRLSGLDLSAVGVRRPTTGAAHACVWSEEGAAPLLDWLGVPKDRRFSRHDAPGPTTQEGLHGLVLLDLPDFDSIHESHRNEVDRLLRLVDLIVWVTDPQKYADQVIHDQYLRTFHRHHESTVVVLNQADRLSDGDVRRCLADLRSLLDRDGLGGVPTYAVSATTTHPGVEPLVMSLRTAVSERMAALQRLAADVLVATDRLTRLIGPDVGSDAINRETTQRLNAALAVSAGVPAVTDATARSYRFRARATMGWPITKWLRRARVDPLRRLRVGVANRGGEPSSLPAASPTQRSTATLATRALADRAAKGLPPPWPAAVMAAARAHDLDLPDALDRAVVTTDLGTERKPVWWRFVGALQWLVTVVGLAGAVWLLARVLLIAIGFPAFDIVKVGRVPLATVLLVGGALAGFLISLLVKPLVAAGAKRARSRAANRMNIAVAEIGREMVINAVSQVLADYTEAKAALADAQR